MGKQKYNYNLEEETLMDEKEALEIALPVVKKW